MLHFLKSFFTATASAEEQLSTEDSSESLESVEYVQAKEEDVRAKEPDEHEHGIALTGAFYLIDGRYFECLIPECEVDFDGRMLIINNQENQSTPKIFRIDKIRNMRQHLPDSFQYLVHDSKDSGEEFGIQFTSEQKALEFRRLIFAALLDTAKPVIELECALAEYYKKSREFVLVSKSATACIWERPSDNEIYFSIENRLNHESEDRMDHRLFVDNLSKDNQIWPSVETNQLTFWGIHHQAVGITKSMFLMEMDPLTVGRAAIGRFFRFIVEVLEDRNFSVEKSDPDEETPVLADDEDFDVGPLGDPHMQREWRQKDGSSRHHRHSFSRDSDDEEHRDEYEGRYSTEPLYSASSKDALVHRFMGVGADRTFVCRGDQGSPKDFGRRKKGTQLQMKVYKREQGSDGEEYLEGVGSVDGKKFTYKGEQFMPSGGLLHQQEKKLLVVPEHDVEGDVYLMDLSTEKIVQKWDAGGTSIQTMFPTFKNGQSSQDPTFLCSNSQNVFMMDTRMDKNAKSTSISYLTNPKLCVGATDEKGHIVMGSRLGALRLFDGEANAKGDFKRAKTLLETIREPITAVDVTRDGAWIVATTKTFLVIFCTRLVGTGKTGFETALGQKKPPPRYLMLTPDDLVKYQITEIDFAPAKFDAEEDSIVTSTGNMAVVWDFGTVKRGKPIYSIRFANNAIKDVQIATNSESVVVAYPTAVGLFGTERKRLDEL